jgi:hypothetical protein
VLFPQLLDVLQGRVRMRADAVIAMQQHLLETAVYTHALVFGTGLPRSAARRFSKRTGTSTRLILLGGPALNKLLLASDERQARAAHNLLPPAA